MHIIHDKDFSPQRVDNVHLSLFCDGDQKTSVEGFFIINPPFVAYLFHNHYLCHTGKSFFKLFKCFRV